MTAPSIRSYMQIFSRFGLTWHRKFHFSTFSGKLTFQSTRNGHQNLPFCPGSLQDTFSIFPRCLTNMFRKYVFPKKTVFLKNWICWPHVAIEGVLTRQKCAENGAQLYGPRVSYFLSYRLVRSLTFRIFCKLEFQCTRNGPQNLPFCPGSIQNTFLVFPR